MTPNFKYHVVKAIQVLSKFEGALDDADAYKLLVSHEINITDAKEILAFLPTAFIRCMLPKVQWADTFLEYEKLPNKSQLQLVTKRYDETPSYLIIRELTDDYFANAQDGKGVVKIAFRSAEYNIMNPILLNDPDLEPEEIKLSDVVVNRY